MQLDMELVRKVLVAVEALPFDEVPHEIQVAGSSPEAVGYHVMILDEADLIKARQSMRVDGFCWDPIRLTYEGHKFLDAARSDTVWNKAKSMILKQTGTLTLEAFKTALPIAIKSLLETMK
jgi:hypothetical protein